MRDGTENYSYRVYPDEMYVFDKLNTLQSMSWKSGKWEIIKTYKKKAKKSLGIPLWTDQKGYIENNNIYVTMASPMSFTNTQGWPDCEYTGSSIMKLIPYFFLDQENDGNTIAVSIYQSNERMNIYAHTSIVYSGDKYGVYSGLPGVAPTDPVAITSVYTYPNDFMLLPMVTVSYGNWSDQTNYCFAQTTYPTQTNNYGPSDTTTMQLHPAFKSSIFRYFINGNLAGSRAFVDQTKFAKVSTDSLDVRTYNVPRPDLTFFTISYEIDIRAFVLWMYDSKTGKYHPIYKLDITQFATNTLPSK